MCLIMAFSIYTHLIFIHTAGAHALLTHTYNILPCFESIRGSPESPLHELFVINERARWLLLWWLSERTQLCHRELRKQHQLLVNTVCALFIWLPEYVILFLFGPQKTLTVDGSDSRHHMNTLPLLSKYPIYSWETTVDSYYRGCDRNVGFLFNKAFYLFT